MLKQEQLRPFLLGALISAAGIIIVNYTAANEGYFQCMKDVAHIKFKERQEQSRELEVETLPAKEFQDKVPEVK